MKKHILLILALCIGLNSAPAFSMQNVARVGHQKFLEAQKAYKQTRERIQRNWFCLRHPNQCSKENAATARTWFITVPTSVIIATLALIGVAIGTKKVIDMKNQMTKNQEGHSSGLSSRGSLPPFIPVQQKEELQKTIETANLWTTYFNTLSNKISPTILASTQMSATGQTIYYINPNNVGSIQWDRLRERTFQHYQQLNNQKDAIAQSEPDNPLIEKANMAAESLKISFTNFFDALKNYLTQERNPYVATYTNPFVQ